MKYVYVSPAMIGARLMSRVGPGPIVVNVDGREHHAHRAEILGPDGEPIATVRFERHGSPNGRVHVWIESEAPIRTERTTL